MNDIDWLFPDPQNVATVTLRQIMNDGVLIDRVWHDDDDGQWQFLSSAIESKAEYAMLVALKEIVKIDSTIMQLYDLPFGWHAWRNAKNEPWQREPSAGN